MAEDVKVIIDDPGRRIPVACCVCRSAGLVSRRGVDSRLSVRLHGADVAIGATSGLETTTMRCALLMHDNRLGDGGIGCGATSVTISRTGRLGKVG